MFAWGPILSRLTEREKFIRRRSRRPARSPAAEARLSTPTSSTPPNEGPPSSRVAATPTPSSADRGEGRDEAQKMLERARREIGLAKEGAVLELYQVSARATTEIVGRILQREINSQDHERLIRDSLTRLLERGN
jgi:F0F1-type ATP synthase membrane subunit b/b'